MLSFLPGISIKFERNAFKVEKSKKDLGAVCKSDLFWAICAFLLFLIVTPRAGALEWPNAMRAKNINNYITITLLNY
jgi:hypothetical protein